MDHLSRTISSSRQPLTTKQFAAQRQWACLRAYQDASGTSDHHHLELMITIVSDHHPWNAHSWDLMRTHGIFCVG
jgi:hypothetical protein